MAPSENTAASEDQQAAASSSLDSPYSPTSEVDEVQSDASVSMTSSVFSSDWAQDYLSPLDKFDDIIDNHLKPFLKASDKVSRVVASIAEYLKNNFEIMREMVQLAQSGYKTNSIDSKLLPMCFYARNQGFIKGSAKLSESSPFFHHITLIIKVIAVLNAMVLGPETVPRVQHHMAKIKTKFENSDNAKCHKEWLKSLQNLLSRLVDYSKSTFPEGIEGEQLKDLCGYTPHRIQTPLDTSFTGSNGNNPTSSDSYSPLPVSAHNANHPKSGTSVQFDNVDQSDKLTTTQKIFKTISKKLSRRRLSDE